jgi:hypothetical protein
MWDMQTTVHSFTLSLNWELIRFISQIDRFDASWASIEKREGQSLKQLKSIATVRSVGIGWRETAEGIEAVRARVGATCVLASDYGTTAWLAGHADHFRMVWGEQSARSVPHLATAYRLADSLGAFPDPDLAEERMKLFLTVSGVQQ